MNHQYRAFTLVEVITVIVVVLLLSGLATVAVGPGIARAKTQPGCESNLKQIASAYVMYLADYDDGMPTVNSLVNIQPYADRLAQVDRCPLSKATYWDNVLDAITLPKSGLVRQNTFADGSPIPHFDKNLDVLYRCLDHGFGGYSRGTEPGLGRNDGCDNRGKVLGVRLDGEVSKVSSYSCWELRYYSNLNSPVCTQSLWRNCDRPSGN